MIKSRCKIVIKGLNQERAISHISQAVKIYNYKRDKGQLSQLEVDYKNQKVLKKMLKQHNIDIVQISGRGIKHFFRGMLTSYGIIVGIVFSLLLFALQSVFVLKIEVFGQEKGQNGQIESYIGDLLTTRLKWEIDTKNLENQILQEFDGVSSASVAIIGQTLVINLNEIQPPQEMQEDFAPIVSEYDGRITKINLVQGTLAVEKGDIVKKGDILVYPYVIDAEGVKRNTAAKAEILADVWLQARETHYDVSLKTERTGRKIVYNNIYLNNLLIFSGQKTNPFQEYESEKYWQQLTDKLIFPFRKEKIIIYETCTKEIREDFAAEKENIIENARKKALIFLQENEIIKEETYNIKEESGWHEVTYVLSVERNIGG